MRIEELEIENFRAIERASIDTRSTMIVIAGCFFREVLLRAEDFRPKAA